MSHEVMWAAYCRATGIPLELEHQVDSFGDSVAMANELAGLVAAGIKRATACLAADFDAGDGAISSGTPGDLCVIVDGSERAKCVVRTIEIRVGAFESADERFAFDEGEGDRSLGGWIQSHEAYFRRRCNDLAIPWNRRIPVVFERFEVVWPIERA